MLLIRLRVTLVATIVAFGASPVGVQIASVTSASTGPKFAERIHSGAYVDAEQGVQVGNTREQSPDIGPEFRARALCGFIIANGNRP